MIDLKLAIASIFLFLSLTLSAQFSVSSYMGLGKDKYLNRQEGANQRSGQSHGSDDMPKYGINGRYQIPSRIWRLTTSLEYSFFTNYSSSFHGNSGAPFGWYTIRTKYRERYESVSFSVQIGIRKNMGKRFRFYTDVGFFTSKIVNANHSYFYSMTYNDVPTENYSYFEEGEELDIPNMGFVNHTGYEVLLTNRIGTLVGFEFSLHQNILGDKSKNVNKHLESSFYLGLVFHFADQYEPLEAKF